MLEEASKHQSVSQASEINWLRVWEAARDKGPYWTKISQTFYKLLTKPLFGERICQLCDSYIPEHTLVSSAISLKFTPQATLTSVTSWITSTRETLTQTLHLSIS